MAVFEPRRGDVRRYVPVLDLDADLGRLLDAEANSRARQRLVVQVATVAKGSWDVSGISSVSASNLGLLLLDGVVAREIALNGTVSTELLGRGDVIRPWSDDGEEPLAGAEVRWNVLSEGRFALLDTAFAGRAAAFPGIGAILLERLEARTRRLALLQAIAHMTRVDERVLALMWHLCDRWGRVTPDGVLLPLRLSHRTIAELVGARRPTVSSAIGELARRELLARRDDGAWLLLGEQPPARRRQPESVAQRRTLIAVDPFEEPPQLQPPRFETGAVEITRDAAGGETGARLRENVATQISALSETLSRTSELRRESAALIAARTRTRRSVPVSEG
jgi:hypothetical protein